MHPSMGSVGDAYDNTLCELLRHPRMRAPRSAQFCTKAEARMAVFQFIEGCYNPGRSHLALGYLSPINYDRAVRQRLQSVSP